MAYVRCSSGGGGTGSITVEEVTGFSSQSIPNRGSITYTVGNNPNVTIVSAKGICKWGNTYTYVWIYGKSSPYLSVGDSSISWSTSGNVITFSNSSTAATFTLQSVYIAY